MRGGEGDLHPLVAVGPPLVPICVGEDFRSRPCPATQAWCPPMGVLRLVVARPNVFLRVIGREAAVSRWPFPATQTLPRCRTRDRRFLGVKPTPDPASFSLPPGGLLDRSGHGAAGVITSRFVCPLAHGLVVVVCHLLGADRRWKSSICPPMDLITVL